jgi:hypothetical protein
MDPSKDEKTAPEVPPAQVVNFPLSDFQNRLVSRNLERIQAALIDLQRAQKEAEQVRALARATEATLEARAAAHRSAVEANNQFLSYIINEFELPPTIADEGWAPVQVEEGKYALVGKVDKVPALPDPAKKAPPEPKHPWKKRGKSNVQQMPAPGATATPPAEHNPTA